MGASYSPQDMNNNPFLQSVLEYLSTRPNGMVKGRFFYDSILGPGYYDGTNFRPFDAKFQTDGTIPISGLATNPLLRSNHTGTQAASTISDLGTTVKGYTLDSFAAPVNPVNINSQRLAAVGAATQDSDAPNYGQIKTLIAQSIAGQKAIKNPVRAVFTSNITLSGYQTADGITGSASDSINRWLVSGQTDATLNGIYAQQSSAWIRVTDADEPAEWLEGTEVLVLSGTNYAGSIWRQTGAGTNGVVTPGTSAMNFTTVRTVSTYSGDEVTITLSGSTFSLKKKANGGIINDTNGVYLDPAVATRKVPFTITGDGSTAQFTVTHNLNNANPDVAFKDGNGKKVDIDVQHVDANSFKVVFGSNSIPTNAQSFAGTAYG